MSLPHLSPLPPSSSLSLFLTHTLDMCVCMYVKGLLVILEFGCFFAMRIKQ